MTDHWLVSDSYITRLGRLENFLIYVFKVPWHMYGRIMILEHVRNVWMYYDSGSCKDLYGRIMILDHVSIYVEGL